MTIECAILGMLSEGPQAGYDLKKRIGTSPVMPWSGNNNQVYKALSALDAEGLVTSEVFHQEGLPSRKVYTITPLGRQALKEWLNEPVEMMELGKPLVAKLKWMDVLGANRIDELLDDYDRQLRAGLGKRPAMAADGLSGALWALAEENIRLSFEMEIDWVKRAREAISEYREEARDQDVAESLNGVTQMEYQVKKQNGQTLLHYRASQNRPEAIDETQMVGDCILERTNLVMIDEGALPEAFFRLSTGVAGAVLQKLVQYHVKAALIVDEKNLKGKFREMMLEANRAGALRSFENRAEAARWLTGEDGQ